MTQPTTTTVAGLTMPTGLWDRIVAAVRGEYPDLTSGITDDRKAMAAVLKSWLAATLAAWEARQVVEPVIEQTKQMAADAETQGKAARQKAQDDAQTGIAGP